MKNITAIFTIILSFTIIGSAQFSIPKLPKIDVKKPADTKTASTSSTTSTLTNPASGSGNNAAASVRPATTILKPTLTVRAARDLGYWKQPDAPNFWSWMPQIRFTVTGPIPDSSYFTYEFTKADGSPWFSIDTEPFAVSEGNTREFESEAVPRWKDKRTTIETGTFGFKVTLKNSLNGTSKEMYKGTFKVGKKFAGTEHKDFKNQYAFYVENDWILPIGYASYETKQNPNAPMLELQMWFRGDYGNDRLNAYIFKDGKQISSTKVSNQGIGNSGRNPLITEGDNNNEFYWSQWKFTFYNLRAFDSNGNFPDALILKNNPGNYEVKVLLDGELVRTASFSIGNNGEIVDNGIAANNGFGGTGVVIPVKVIPAKEGKLNLTSWKTDAFYSNPLSGFSVQ